MSRAGLRGQLAPTPPVTGGDAGVFRLGIVTCPPGNGAGLHAHWKTHEFDDVGRVPETAEKVAQKFGPQMVEKLKSLGCRFTLDANAPPEAPG